VVLFSVGNIGTVLGWRQHWQDLPTNYVLLAIRGHKLILAYLPKLEGVYFRNWRGFTSEIGGGLLPKLEERNHLVLRGFSLKSTQGRTERH
jgi:hypothetical protein